MNDKKFVCSVAQSKKENLSLKTFILWGDSKKQVEKFIDEEHPDPNTLIEVFRLDNLKAVGEKSTAEALDNKVDKENLNESMKNLVDDMEDKEGVDLTDEERDVLSRVYYKLYEEKCLTPEK